MSKRPLDVAAVIDCSGDLFVLIPDSEDRDRWKTHGLPLSVSELRQLYRKNDGEMLSREFVRGLASVKRVLGGVVIKTTKKGGM